MLGASVACSSADGVSNEVTGGAGGSAATSSSSGSTGNGLSGASGAAVGGGAPTLDAPADAESLLPFLTRRQYAGWAKEEGYHPSTGPHGDAVRVYYSPKAAAALEAGALTLPSGAAAVKELTSGGSLYGFSVWVKVRDAADRGNGFFWYEIIQHGGGNDTIYGNAFGSEDCVGCHQAGKDYNLSTLPFK